MSKTVINISIYNPKDILVFGFEAWILFKLIKN